MSTTAAERPQQLLEIINVLAHCILCSVGNWLIGPMESSAVCHNVECLAESHSLLLPGSEVTCRTVNQHEWLACTVTNRSERCGQSVRMHPSGSLLLQVARCKKAPLRAALSSLSVSSLRAKKVRFWVFIQSANATPRL